MEYEDGPVECVVVNDKREAVIAGFNFLRRNRTTAQRAEQLGQHLAGLTDFSYMCIYPEKVKKYLLTRDGAYLTEDEVKAYRPKTLVHSVNSRTVTSKHMIVVEPVRLKESGIVAVRRKSDFKIAQLVVPEMLTYVGSVATTDEVLASADERGKLFGPFGGELLPISIEYIESLDAVFTEYSSVLGLPEPGKL